MATDRVATTRVVSKAHPGGYYEINTSEYDVEIHGKEYEGAEPDGPPSEPTVPPVKPPSNN